MKVTPISWNASQWHTLFMACQQQLLAYLHGKTGNRDEAQELAQEAWLRVAQSPPALPEGATPTHEAARAYLFATAKHLAIDRRRREGLHHDCLQDLARIQPVSGNDVAEQAMYRQAVLAIEQVLLGLPPRMRATLEAHRLHGEKQADIAARLGVSLNTVERDLMQADACLEAALHRWRGSSAGERQAVSGQPRRRKALTALLGVAAMAGTGWPAWQLWRQRLLWEYTLTSQRGQQLRQDLDDGSQVHLDADSQLALAYHADRRWAQLRRGAAFFDVARDENRPFVVQTDSVQITVLGTRFGVELEPQGVRVQVESGRVQVQQQGRVQVLHAQEELWLPRGDAAQHQTGQDWAPRPALRAAAWRQGELVFEQEALARVLQRLARYNPRRVEVAPEVADLRLSGHVQLAQADAWLRSLPQLAPVRLQWRDDGSVAVARR